MMLNNRFFCTGVKKCQPRDFLVSTCREHGLDPWFVASSPQKSHQINYLFPWGMEEEEPANSTRTTGL